MTDIIDVVADEFLKNDVLKDVVIKSFVRPEALPDDASSIVILPVGPPNQSDFASDKPLRKQWMFQVNVETTDYSETKRLAREVEKEMLALSFFQSSGGLDEFFPETGRYVDARTYVGYSKAYDIN